MILPMPLTPVKLAAEKAKFLNKPSFGLTTPQQAGWQKIAFRDAMTSASRRARLYRKGLIQSQRDSVRAGWQAQLTLLVTAYVANGPQFATQQQFLLDVAALQQFMNANHASFFHTATTATVGYAPGFRIAHAQKSLSLVLKHFWCNGVLSEPPCCPVDRSVLVCAGASQQTARWTDLNTIRVPGEACPAVNGRSSRSTKSLVGGVGARGFQLSQLGRRSV